MERKLYQTQDPWMDIGLVVLYQTLWNIHSDDPDLLEEPELNPGYLSFSFDEDQADEFKNKIVEKMKDQINSVLLPAPELKLLHDTNWMKKNEQGYYNEQYKKTLSDTEIEELKKILTQPKKEVEISCVRNFIGSKGDWRNLTKEVSEYVNSAIEQWKRKVDKGKKCPLCSLKAPSKDFCKMNQYKNVLFNQHHNNPVRGYSKSVQPNRMCPTCNLLNLFATLAVQSHPYFVSSNKVTHLLVPVVSSLQSLQIIFDVIGASLYQNIQQNKEIISYRTNIKELKHKTLFVSLLQLYYWLNHVQKESGLKPLSDQDHDAIKGWIIPRYTKGKNVIFREFTRPSVNADHFRLTLPVFFKGGDYRGDVVNQFLNQIRTDDERLVDQIAEGIFRKDTRLIVQNMYQLLKRSIKEPSKYKIHSLGCLFFRDFIPYFYTMLQKEEINVFDEQLHEDLRLLGQSIGQLNDLSSLNKLNTASTLNAFISALKEAFFKLYKEQIANQKNNKSEELYNIGSKRMAHIISQLQDKNLFLIRDTLMIYACLAGFQANNRKNQAKESMER